MKPVHRKLTSRFLMVLVTCAAIPLSQAEDQNQLNKECYRENKGRSCVRLGTTLWQTPDRRAEAVAAFSKGCDLKVESACTLKSMGVNTTPETAKPEPVGIEKTGPHSYNIPRAMLTKYAGDLENTLSTARMVTHKDGFRFKTIDKGSVFEKLGFEVGDIVSKVNDQKIGTREDAIGMLPGLLYGSADKYAVEAIRGGKTFTQNFRIVE